MTNRRLTVLVLIVAVIGVYCLTYAQTRPRPRPPRPGQASSPSATTVTEVPGPQPTAIRERLAELKTELEQEKAKGNNDKVWLLEYEAQQLAAILAIQTDRTARSPGGGPADVWINHLTEAAKHLRAAGMDTASGRLMVPVEVVGANSGKDGVTLEDIEKLIRDLGKALQRQQQTLKELRDRIEALAVTGPYGR